MTGPRMPQCTSDIPRSNNIAESLVFYGKGVRISEPAEIVIINSRRAVELNFHHGISGKTQSIAGRGPANHSGDFSIVAD